MLIVCVIIFGIVNVIVIVIAVVDDVVVIVALNIVEDIHNTVARTLWW